MQRLIVVIFIMSSILSCSRDPLSVDETTGTPAGNVAINMIFDEAPAKVSAVATNETYIALIVIYDRTGSLVSYQSKQLFGNQIIETVKVPASSGYTVKLTGFDKPGNITYQGITYNVKVLPNATSNVDVHMNYMGFVEIPGGTFSMGSETGEEDERPEHTVTVNPFLMHSTEVTQFQAKRLLQYYNILNLNEKDFLELKESVINYFTDDPTHPATNIKWSFIARMCNKMSEMDGLDSCYSADLRVCDITKNGYRMPTEAEWEYACRAQTDTQYSSGNTAEDLGKVGWFEENTHIIREVGMKEPNAWGLYDMHGNAWEWCFDSYAASYYSRSPEDNPMGPGYVLSVVIRGGSFESPADQCRSSSRHSSDRSIFVTPIGTRIVRSLD